MLLMVDTLKVCDTAVAGSVRCSALFVWLMISLGFSALIARADDYRLGSDDFAIIVRSPADDLLADYGPRFDLTGRVVSLRCDGQEWLGEPGLADEFNFRSVLPPGFRQSYPGNVFLKPGVGTLARISMRRYFFAARYPIVERASVRVVEQTSQSLVVSQDFVGPEGFAYRYEKRYTVDIARHLLLISYRFQNAGERSLPLSQYNHNTFLRGGDAGAWRLDSPFNLTGASEGGFAVVDGVVGLAGPLEDDTAAGEVAFFVSPQYVDASANRALLVEESAHRRVEVAGDFPVFRFQLFSDASVVCPEVFYRVELEPGQEVRWERSYRFGD